MVEHVEEDRYLFHDDRKHNVLHKEAKENTPPPPQGLGTSDLLPAARSHLLKFPQPPKTVLSSGEQVFKI